MPVGGRRIAIYLRRSTDDEHQPFSISAQEAALLNYIGSQAGWTLVAKYSDDASGATTGRPDLQRALTAARAGRFDVLLVVRVNRFSRRLSDLLALLAELDDSGVAFVSATEPFDTSTSIGRMLVQLLGVFAEFERETIIDRVTKGMAAKAAKGKWPGGRRPYGYYADRDTQKLIPHPEEAPHLKEIFRLYADQRFGTRAIAAELNRRGVRNRTGKPWSGHAVARILANPAYAGDIAHGDVYAEDTHEALIDRPTWQRAASIAAERAGPQTQRAASNSDYDLTGKITCPGCGHKYIGTSATGRSRTYRYYTCFSRVRYGTHGCDAARPPPTTPKPPSSTPSPTSTPRPPPSSPTPSPAPRPATATVTLTGTPKPAPSSPRSRTSRPRSTGTSPRSRTALWTTPPPAPASSPCKLRSTSSRPATARSPTPSATSPPRPRPTPSSGSAPTCTTFSTPARPPSAKPPSKPLSPRSASPGKESSRCSESPALAVLSPEKPAQPAPARSRFAQWCVRWGAWGSNPEPTD